MSVHIAFETPKDVQDSVYELVKLVGSGEGRLKKGSNEVTKAAERGTAQMIVMAENVNPAEPLAPLSAIINTELIFSPSSVISVAEILFIISDATLSVHFDHASITLLYFSPLVISPSAY